MNTRLKINRVASVRMNAYTFESASTYVKYAASVRR